MITKYKLFESMSDEMMITKIQDLIEKDGRREFTIMGLLRNTESEYDVDDLVIYENDDECAIIDTFTKEHIIIDALTKIKGEEDAYNHSHFYKLFYYDLSTQNLEKMLFLLKRHDREQSANDFNL